MFVISVLQFSTYVPLNISILNSFLKTLSFNLQCLFIIRPPVACALQPCRCQCDTAGAASHHATKKTVYCVFKAYKVDHCPCLASSISKCFALVPERVETCSHDKHGRHILKDFLRRSQR